MAIAGERRALADTAKRLERAERAALVAAERGMRPEDAGALLAVKQVIADQASYTLCL